MVDKDVSFSCVMAKPPTTQQAPSSSWFRRSSNSTPTVHAPLEPDPYLKESYHEMLLMTMELVDDLTHNWRAGDVVLTEYGSGRLMDCTPKDKDTASNNTVNIKLDWGGVLHSPQSDVIHKLLSPTDYQHAMEHLEQIRRLNVSIQSHDWGVPAQHEDACVACLFQKPQLYSTKTRRQRYFQQSSSTMATVSTFKVTTKTKRCDVCGNPVCSEHKVKMGNAAEGIELFIMCTDCSHDLNQAEHNLNAHHPHLLQNLQRLNQYYTRMVLQLSYCVPNLRQIGYELTHKQKRDGAFNLGNSALGFAGAALGVAGAAAMLTPAGPGLLLAAVATSATSGTVQGVYSSYNLLSPKPAQQLADRCLGWHGLCLGILNSLEQLRQELIEQEHDFMDESTSRLGTMNNHNIGKRKQSLEIWNALAVGSFSTTRQAMTGIGVTSSLGASYSQAISSGLQTIPVVGAAFAVGCMAVDANTMASSFKQLNTPAKKAIALQGVELSFLRQVANTVRPKVGMFIQAVDDLQARMQERRRSEEADLIERELEGLENTEGSDDDIERELSKL